MIITSHEKDFEIDKQQEHHKIVLPKEGSSWICNCDPREKVHRCNPKDRNPYLSVPIKTQGEKQDVTLRVGFYFRNNLLQCRLFTAQVGVKVKEGNFGYEISYRLHFV